MVAVPLGFLLQVLLVRFVRGVKRRRVFDSRFDGFVGVLEVCDFARVQRVLHFAHNLCCCLFLRLVVREDHRSVLRADVVSLAVRRGGVVEQIGRASCRERV